MEEREAVYVKNVVIGTLLLSLILHLSGNVC